MPAYHVRPCPTCARRRRIYTVARVTQNTRPHRQFRCSQGHTWLEEIPTLERISEISRDIFGPAVARIFSEDSVLYQSLRRR